MITNLKPLMFCLLVSLLIASPCLALCLAQSPQQSESGEQSTVVGNTFEEVLQRANNLFQVFDQNSIEPVAKQQFMLHVARAFYLSVGSAAPSDIARQASEQNSDAEFEKWLATHWEKSGLKLTATGTEAPIKDALARLIVQKLDSRARYEDAKSSRVTRQLAENQYVGIGIRVRFTEEKAMIDEPFPGGAAFLAGAIAGDFIMEVDGDSMLRKNLGQIIDILRGSEGSKVSVVVQNKDGSEPRTLDMVRTVIPIPSVKGVKQNDDGSWQFVSAKQPKLAYMRVDQVVGSTSAELKDAVRQAIAKGVAGVILDLRTVRIGELHHVNMIADVLTSGTGFGTLQLPSGTTRKLETNEQSDFEGLPIAVLTPQQNVNGPILALLASLKKRDNTETIGIELLSDMTCQASFELPNNDGSISQLAYARLLPPGITQTDSSHTDMSGHQIQVIRGQVRFTPSRIVKDPVAALAVGKKWLKKKTDK